MAPILILLTVIVCLSIDYVARARKAARLAVEGPVEGPWARIGVPGGVADEERTRLLDVPRGLFLAPGHTWLGVEPEGTVRVGCDRLSLSTLGGVDRMDLLEPGTEVREGDRLVVLRHDGRELPLLAPVSGTIESVNLQAERHARELADAPYGDNWLYRIRPAALGPALRNMQIGEGARAWMAREVERLRDLLAVVYSREAVPVMLQDGGLPVAGLANQLDEQHWNRLVEAFYGRQ